MMAAIAVVGDNFGGDALPGPDGPAASAAWTHMKQCAIIHKVAWNCAEADEVQLFQEGCSRDRSFEKLTLDWRDCYQHCCCGRTEAATRLSAAMYRVDRQRPLPPWGEPLLVDEQDPMDERSIRRLSHLAVLQAITANIAFMHRPEGAPLLLLSRTASILASYENRHIAENGRLPRPLSLQGFEHSILHAFFSYICGGCGRAYTQLGPLGTQAAAGAAAGGGGAGGGDGGGGPHRRWPLGASPGEGPSIRGSAAGMPGSPPGRMALEGARINPGRETAGAARAPLPTPQHTTIHRRATAGATQAVPSSAQRTTAGRMEELARPVRPQPQRPAFTARAPTEREERGARQTTRDATLKGSRGSNST
ncbi:hypothetical protein GJ744_000400 [Endocarpon pusillum]|uniref:Uncharacterized protein n=1 Tax=Endocarpon pusillum TaxID=364733 RepID=A0A8H7E1Z8_9EURO|nr:hypothetical protein GJ744_000400 [Endocarpon pusillum]